MARGLGSERGVLGAWLRDAEPKPRKCKQAGDEPVGSPRRPHGDEREASDAERVGDDRQWQNVGVVGAEELQKLRQTLRLAELSDLATVGASQPTASRAATSPGGARQSRGQ